MPSQNICFSEHTSCSACCGINNIKLKQVEKKNWLIANTQQFLKLNLLDRLQVLKHRESGETFLKALMIRPDVYVCPFLGFTEVSKEKTGCLLHEGGSPHPQIHMIKSPQSFSFYGENICKTYDCLSKQRICEVRSHQISKKESPGFHITEAAEILRGSFVYSKIMGNHNLITVIDKIIEKFPSTNKKILFNIILQRLENKEIPITSFEMPLTLEFFSDQQLWEVLGMCFVKKGYIFDAFKITAAGKSEAERIKVELGIL